MKSKRTISAVAAASLALLAAVVLAACGGGDAGESSSAGEVKMGANTEVSGPFQAYAKPAITGLEAAAKSINEEGGIELEGEGLQTSVVVADNRSEPSAVASAAQKVLTEGAIAALGPDISGEVAYNIWKGKLITFGVAFEQEELAEKHTAENPTLFAPTPFFNPLYEANMEAIAKIYPEIESVAIMAPGNDEGKGAAIAYEYGAKAAGMSVVEKVIYPEETTDFSSYLTKIKGKKPSMVIALQSAPQALAILQQADQLKVAPFGLNDLITPDQLAEQGSPQNMTVLIPGFGPTFSKAATIPDYHPEEIFGSEVPETPAAGIVMYYAYHQVKQAIEAAGTATDVEKIAENLVGQSYEGPFGTCEITKSHENSCENLIEAVEGEKVLVYRYAKAGETEAAEKYECREGKCVKVEGAG